MGTQEVLTKGRCLFLWERSTIFFLIREGGREGGMEGGREGEEKTMTVQAQLPSPLPLPFSNGYLRVGELRHLQRGCGL